MNPLSVRNTKGERIEITMNETLSNFLFALLMLLFSITTTAVTVFLKSKTAQVKNDTARQLLFEIDEAFNTAVTATSQTYVDQLKKSNSFKKDKQEIALNKAKETFKAVISSEADQLLHTMYSTQESLEAFITAKIEEKVKVQKEGFSSLSGK